MLNLPGIQSNVPLAPFTTYKIGGPAAWFVSVQSKNELIKSVTTARNENVPYFLLGTGANILIRDGGIKGLVIHNCSNHIRFAGTCVTAESGATIETLILESSERELSGLEHFVGIPSTVGGAMWQNLHFLAPDRMSTLYIDNVVDVATVLMPNDSIQTVNRDFFQFGYDDSILHHKRIVVRDVTFALTPKPKAEIERQMQDNLAWRVAKQPQLDEYPSCGSVFKKIAGVGSGRLIDEAGLKGFTIGKAQVSSKHANYIVNLGGALASDVEAVIEHVIKTVAAKTGYTLEPEIRIIGEKI